MLNDNNGKYFAIYVGTDTLLYVDVYELSNNYTVTFVNKFILQESGSVNDNNDYEGGCFATLGNELLGITYNGDPFSGRDPKIYAQTWNVTVQ